MFIYLFRDKHSSDIFAFSTDVTGRNIPPATATTKWMFMEAIDVLRFPEPWDIDDFQYVLDHLKTEGFYLFQGEFIAPATYAKDKPAGLSQN
jgi:hypothetical protein